MSDAVALGLFGPILRQIEADARTAANAIDRVGQPTRALSATESSPLERRVVWRTWRAEKGAATTRSVLLMATKLLGEHGDGGETWPRTWPERSDLDALRLLLPEGHSGGWSRLQVVALGLLAWRAAVARGLRVTARAGPNHKLIVRPDVVGLAFAELTNPFEILFRLGILGVALVAWSREAIVLELRA